MKAIVTEAPGGWPATGWKEVPDPVPAPGELLVEIKAAGLNPADYYQIEGSYPGAPAPPFISGRDAAGVVIGPEGHAQFPPGVSVMVLQSEARSLVHGAFATRQRFAPEVLAPLPAGWSFEEGAGAPLVYQTAWRALVEFGKLEGGQVVLVTGASGGVGTAAIQLAAGLGAKVVAFSRSAAKRERLVQFGAHHVFAPDLPDLRDRVFAAIKQRGVDLVVETVGGPSLTTAVHLLGRKGKVMVVGLLAGIEGSIPIPSLMFKEATIQGLVVTGWTASQATASWKRILEVLHKASARPVIDSYFPADQYAQAFEKLKSSPLGKVILRMAK